MHKKGGLPGQGPPRASVITKSAPPSNGGVRHERRTPTAAKIPAVFEVQRCRQTAQTNPSTSPSPQADRAHRGRQHVLSEVRVYSRVRAVFARVSDHPACANRQAGRRRGQERRSARRHHGAEALLTDAEDEALR